MGNENQPLLWKDVLTIFIFITNAMQDGDF